MKPKLKNIIGEAIGEGSICWKPVPPAKDNGLPLGEFDSTAAAAVVDKTVARINELPNLWRDACLGLVEILGKGERHRRPMDFISTADWKKAKDLMKEAGL